MGTVSIQKVLRSPERISRWQHVADTFGLPLTDAQLAEVGEADDLTLARRFLPQLGDAELSEVLWAVGA